MGAGKTYHKACFRCMDCNKMLDATLLAEDKDHNIYCTSCHGKKFGPKGIGFGVLGDTGSGFKGEDKKAASPAKAPAATPTPAPGKGPFCKKCGAGGKAFCLYTFNSPSNSVASNELSFLGQDGKFCGSCGSIM